MNLFLTSEDELVIESSAVTLRGVRPVLNGAPLGDSELQVRGNDAKGIALHYTAPALNDCVFHIEITRDRKARLALRYSIEDLPAHIALDSFGIRFERIENLRAYLRSGYFSWDGSEYVEPGGLDDFGSDETRPETGYAVTQLLPRLGTGSLVLGFDRHDRFQQTFTFDTSDASLPLTILTLWDRKTRVTSSCESEQLVIFEHPVIEGALCEWARLVASASPTPPRHTEPIIGWCSWYNLYAYITEENILEHLRGVTAVVRRESLPMRVFQIDDGFTPEMGDWLEIKPQFPRGMKPLLDDIRAAGFTPGLWIAPFMVGNRSRLYREHPDWVVHNRATGAPLTQKKFYGEYRWHKRSEEYYILDTTHPDAFEYLHRVFHTWRHEWGCGYFKTDFMHFGSEHGPDRAAWHISGMTRIEIWRRVAEMIRAEIGDALWLGCGCPLWASPGLVDGIRIGRDVGVEWNRERFAHSLLRDQATRNFANHILWQADPDCILLRDRFHHLSEAELRSLAIYQAMTGGVLMTSDALDELSPTHLRLWKSLVNSGQAECRYPLLGQSATRYKRLPTDLPSNRVRHESRPVDPVIVQVRTPNPSRTRFMGEPPSPAPTEEESGVAEGSAIFIFNTGDTPSQRTFTLNALGLPAPLYVFDWIAGCAWEQPVERLNVTLAAHDGTLLFVGPTPIPQPPEHLP